MVGVVRPEARGGRMARAREGPGRGLGVRVPASVEPSIRPGVAVPLRVLVFGRRSGETEREMSIVSLVGLKSTVLVDVLRAWPAFLRGFFLLGES
jgi:hypothetical protein